PGKPSPALWRRSLPSCSLGILCVRNVRPLYILILKLSPVSSRKRHLFDQLINEVRASQNATDRFDQAVADTVAMNRTDMRLIDLLEREGRLTAGELAAGTGLTTGAITTAIDRLEH